MIKKWVRWEGLVSYTDKSVTVSIRKSKLVRFEGGGSLLHEKKKWGVDVLYN